MGSIQSRHSKGCKKDCNRNGGTSIGSSLQNPSFRAGNSSYGKSPSRYSVIDDNYDSIEQVALALREAGLESSNLIIGVDFTKSNEWTGGRSFNHRSLHFLGDRLNPYELAISIIGRTLSEFDEDNLIPCFGFGDATTNDHDVFSFYPEEKPCNGFEQVLSRYRELVPQIELAGPTSFAPIIDTAVEIVDSSNGQYHVLLIIADGQVTRSVNTGRGQLSRQERDTINAIVNASDYPLSIVLVGVGDGPWDLMREFDDNIPARAFDNFQFVNFTEIMSKYSPRSTKEKEFALAALMEVPSQYNATLELQLLGCKRGVPKRYPLPPPVGNNALALYPIPTFKEHRVGIWYDPSPAIDSGYRSVSCYNHNCPVCLWRTKSLAFGCGHQTCVDCGKVLTFCPTCKTEITTRVKLYG